MEANEWHAKYKQCILDNTPLTDKEAQECLDAGMGEYDYNNDPVEAALSEMSYWEP